VAVHHSGFDQKLIYFHNFTTSSFRDSLVCMLNSAKSG